MFLLFRLAHLAAALVRAEFMRHQPDLHEAEPLSDPAEGPRVLAEALLDLVEGPERARQDDHLQAAEEELRLRRNRESRRRGKGGREGLDLRRLKAPGEEQRGGADGAESADGAGARHVCRSESAGGAERC